MNKSVIIIGSGLGGLCCGVMLSRQGYKVTILEQQARPGGCLQCFTRGGERFETGMHFIGSAGPDELLWLMFRYLGVYDRLELMPLDTDAFDTVILADERFDYPLGYDRVIEKLSQRFPHEATNIRSFFELVKQVAGASAMHKLSLEESDFVLTTKYQMECINSVIDSYFTDPLLRRILVGNIPLYAGVMDKTPFGTYAFITDFYLRSAYRFKGGSETLSDALIDELQRHGGTLVTSAKVVEVVCDDHRAVEAVTEDGRRFPADSFISTAHPARTMEMLHNTRLLRPAFRRRMSELPNSIGAFTVYLKFRPGAMPYLNSNVYDYPGGNPWGCEDYTDVDWPRGYLYMHFSRDEATDTALTGVLISYMRYDDVKQWEGTSPMKRGKEYADFKDRHAQRLLDLVESRNPGLKDCIESYYTSTPLTYRDYTGVEAGAMYGVAKDVSMGAASHVSHVTRIPNLYLSGQNINFHGILGVIVGAIITCSEYIPLDTIFSDIKTGKLT